MRATLSLLALVVIGAMAAVPTVAVHGQTSQTTYLSGLVGLLDEGKVAFGITVDARADPVALSANRNIDFVFYDMEHGPFDVTALRTWMQWLLDPGAIASAGDVKAAKTVIVRIPASGRELEQNTWMVKQVLDAGVHGVIFPTIETPEQALTAVRAMRYPQKVGASDAEPAGLRGTNPRLAARYWGLSVPEYTERADIWRLDRPNGNLVPWILIESPRGVANVREVARQLKANSVGAVLFAGSETAGDMLNTHGGDLELARSEYLDRRENVLALGNSGTGKTHLALALGLAACQKGYRVRFTTAAALVNALLEARDDKRLLRVQKQLAKQDLLIVDELGYVPLSKTGAELLFEIFSQRYEQASTLVTSNLPFNEWTESFGSERLTGARLDRLTHHVHILELNGESYRLEHSKKPASPRPPRRPDASPRDAAFSHSECLLCPGGLSGIGRCLEHRQAPR